MIFRKKNIINLNLLQYDILTCIYDEINIHILYFFYLCDNIHQNSIFY